MKKHKAIILILAGVVIGLGISASFNLAPSSSSAETASRAAELRQELDTIQSGSRAFIESIPKVAELLTPAVVSIHTEQKRPEPRPVPRQRRPGPERHPFGPFRFFFDEDLDFWHPWERHEWHGRPRQGLGSGVIVDGEGHILTNNHVVSGFKHDEITITTADGTSHKLEKIVGTDPKTDIAVLKIASVDIVPATLGDSAKMRVGDWAVAIGSPFGYSHSVSAGIISAVGRRNVLPSGPRPAFSYQNFIQTDASINPGNSGGPLVNLKGEVIGINTAIASRNGGYQGIGFAIPSQMAEKVLNDLVRTGKVTRGYLGVEIANLTDRLAKAHKFNSLEEMRERFGLKDTDGVFVNGVAGQTPAERAGLRPGDVIVEIDGQKTSSTPELADHVAGLPVGKKVPLVVIREGQRKELSVEIGEQPESLEVSRHYGQRGAPEAGPGSLGLSVQKLTPELARELGYDGFAGVVVTAVARGSRAERAGLEEGDLIVKVIVDGDYRAVTTPEELANAVKDADKDGKGVAMLVRDKRGQHFVLVK